jgi:hypothetical protein
LAAGIAFWAGFAGGDFLATDVFTAAFTGVLFFTATAFLGAGA